MFSDNEHLKKFVEPSEEEKRKVMSGRWTRKMMANSFYGAYVPDQFKLCVECPDHIANITADINQNVENVF